jgi:hypothetical protein
MIYGRTPWSAESEKEKKKHSKDRNKKINKK